jgi:ATP-dependent helicase/nuclease subunit A
VVAITFTEAAAAEMAERIAVGLHAVSTGCAVQGLPAGELHEFAASRATELLQNIDHLQVRTIHAFCRHLLVGHPLEARLHPDFEVDARGDRTAQIVRETVEEHLALAFESDAAASVFALLNAGIQPSDIENAVASLVAESLNPDDLNTKPFENNNLSSFVLGIRDLITDVLHAAGDSFEGLRAGNATKLHRGLVGFRGILEPATPLGQIQATLDEQIPSNLRAHLQKAWARGDAGKAETEVLSDMPPSFAQAAARLGPALDCLAGLQENEYRLAVGVVGPILEATLARLRESGLIGFSDLLSRATRLMRNPGVAATVRDGMDQLMVDEFQDTDIQQCELIRHLALKGPTDGRPGLFLVGDPKQSIYGWRNADLRAYEGFVSELIDGGAVEHGLVQNFRSIEPILSEVDAVMGQLMVEEVGIQPKFEALVAARGPGPGGAAVEIWPAWKWDGDQPVPDTSARDGREIEAKALAADLIRLAKQGTDLSEVGVLFRSMTELDVYQRAMRAAGVPYEVTRDRNYFRRREIVEAASIVRAILDPCDTLALVGLLRSAVVSAPDASLMPLWGEKFPLAWERLGLGGTLESACDAVDRAGAMVDDLSDDIPGLSLVHQWVPRLKEFLGAVLGLRDAYRTMPFDQWVARLRSDTLIEVLASTAYQGAYRVANLELFFRGMVSEMEESGGDLQGLLRGLRNAVAAQQEAEEARPSGETGAVRLMTIHKAKGLAFTHTYLVDLHHGLKGASRPKGTVVDLTAGIQLMGFWPPGFNEAWSRDAEVSAAERVRLLYVAMTRARDRLVLMGVWPTEPKGRRRARVMADLWGERQPPLPSPVSIAQAVGPGGDTVVEGLRWVFTDGSIAEETPSFQRTTKEAESFRQPVPEAAVEAARVHQERPWTQGPSSAGHHDAPEGIGSVDRPGAMAVGTAIHWIFEQLPRSGPVPRSVSTELLARALSIGSGGAPLTHRAKERALELVGGLERGRLLGLFEEAEILGLEVPLLMEPEPRDSESPAGAWVGSIDLLYRDPVSGEVVVADFKTDQVGDRLPQDVANRHRDQGRVYVDAVQRAMGLAAPPRFEIWLVENDQCVPVSTIQP